MRRFSVSFDLNGKELEVEFNREGKVVGATLIDPGDAKCGVMHLDPDELVELKKALNELDGLGSKIRSLTRT